MFFLIAIAFLLKRYGTQAVPLSAPTPASSPFDMPIFARDDPSDGCHSRTILDIIWSCLATTFACTWVSVHPNVSFRGEGKWTLLRRRFFFMFFSILAPEFMIMWAFKQWRGAVMIRENINKAIKVSPNPQNLIREPWTTTHGHMLQMGGFRVSCTGRDNSLYDLLPVHRKQYLYRHEISEGSWSTDYNPISKLSDDIWEGVLTFDALKKLLSENLIRFPTITEDEIDDLSKADALSKGLALLQLTWFIVQIVTRATQGLAITELELTTAALAGLNSVLYFFWWGKPRDVRFPVVIRTKTVEKLLVERIEDTTWSFSYTEQFDLRKHLWTSMTTPAVDVLSTLRKSLVSSPKTIRNVRSELASALKVLPHRLHSSLTQFYGYFLRAIGNLKRGKSSESKRTSEQESSDAPVVDDPEPYSTKENMSRMQQAYEILIIGTKTAAYCLAFLLSVPAYVITVCLLIPISQALNNDENLGSVIPMVFDTDQHVTSLYMMFYSEDAGYKPLFSTATIAGALSGGVHCLAWHFSFPSHAEQIMWRTASLGLAVACALSFVGTYLFPYIFDIDYDELDGALRKIGYISLIILQIILHYLTTAVYPVFRLMLLVLAVSSLRSLPPSAFDTVQWIEFVPHI